MMTTSGQPCIDISGVERIFQIETAEGSGRQKVEDLVAVTDVNLTVPRGQFVALVGASGCGKTTLLNMLAGLVEPTAGTITLDGERPRLPNMDIGYMFARDALLPWRTALRNVEMPLESRGWSRRRRAERAREMLELVGLEGRERQFRIQLSQGMRQRVALARTLAPDPSVLLMDEPFAAVDARTKLALQTEFLRIWEQHQGGDSTKTVIFVTHDLNEAALLADRVITMLPNPGRIAQDQMIELPRPRAEFLGDVMFRDDFKQITQFIFEGLEGAIKSR